MAGLSESLQLSITTSLYPAIPANHESEEDEFMLPGEGEIKFFDGTQRDGQQSKCGDTKKVEKCDDKHKCDYPRKLIPWDCGRYECPVCNERAVNRGAMTTRNKVWATLQLVKKAIPNVNWFVSSVIISLPPRLYDLDYEEQHAYLRKALKKLGALGVAAIYHRWRYRDLETGMEFDQIPWKEYEKNPDRYKRVLGVHWHCFVIGKMIDSPVWEKETGMVYKKMKSETTNSYELTQADIFRISHYALTHHALSTTKRRHATHYYGVFWRSSVLKKWYDTEPVMCPKCNNQRVHRIEYQDWWGQDCTGLEEPAVKPIVHRKWMLRGYDGVEWTDWNSNKPPNDELDDGLDFTGIDAPVKEVEFVDL